MDGRSKFKIKNFSLKKMNEFGFKLSHAYSKENIDAYVHYFTVYKYLDMGILDARIIIYSDREVKIDIIDRSSKGIYAPWYTESPDRWEILKEIEKNLLKIMKKLEIKDVTTKSKKIKRKRKNTNKGES